MSKQKLDLIKQMKVLSYQGMDAKWSLRGKIKPWLLHHPHRFDFTDFYWHCCFEIILFMAVIYGLYFCAICVFDIFLFVFFILTNGYHKSIYELSFEHPKRTSLISIKMKQEKCIKLHHWTINLLPDLKYLLIFSIRINIPSNKIFLNCETTDFINLIFEYCTQIVISLLE